MAFSISPPEPLAETHDLARFDSGRPVLDDWLRQQALRSNALTARTFVVCVGTRVVGYHCLAAGAVDRSALPSARLRQNSPHQIPVVVLGRLAVDREFHGQGIGKGLLKDAILRSLQAAHTIGIRAILVHPLDDAATAFYARFGFVPSSIGPATMLLPLETAKAALDAK